MAEAGWFLDWVIYKIRQALKPAPSPILEGCCTFASDKAAEILLDITDDYFELGLENHFAVVVKIPTEEDKKEFLLDPTFRQFCEPVRSGSLWRKNVPGPQLSALGGNDIIDKLLVDGWIEMDDRTIELYIRAFAMENPMLLNDRSPKAVFESARNEPFVTKFFLKTFGTRFSL